MFLLQEGELTVSGIAAILVCVGVAIWILNSFGFTEWQMKNKEKRDKKYRDKK